MARITVIIFGPVCILLALACSVFGQKVEAGQKSDSDSTSFLDRTHDASRIEEAHYKLFIYNQNKGVPSNLSVLERTISRENYRTIPSIKISEINDVSKPRTKTVLYIDAKSLKPLYFEMSDDDTPLVRATFDNGKVRIIDVSSGTEKVSETELPPDAYLSNSFSELVEANDFGKNPVSIFSVFTPGKAVGRFRVERIGQQKFDLPDGHQIDCWVLKFTKTDSQGAETPGGYRFVDKKSGKVIMFKSSLDSDTFISYQILL